MKPKNIERRGGKRAGAGAKHKYGEPTTTVAFRIPKSHKDSIKKIIRVYLDQVASTQKAA
jgi:hypothetical protein